jgi:hypothetical protein
LNCITAMARSSSSSNRQVDVLQAKVDALTAVGLAHQCYYDPHSQVHCNSPCAPPDLAMEMACSTRHHAWSQ